MILFMASGDLERIRDECQKLRYISAKLATLDRPSDHCREIERLGRLGFEAKDVSISAHVAGHGTREMRAYNEDGSVGAVCQHLPAGLAGHRAVRISDLREVRHRHLTRMMDEIASDDPCPILGAYLNAGVA